MPRRRVDVLTRAKLMVETYKGQRAAEVSFTRLLEREHRFLTYNCVVCGGAFLKKHEDGAYLTYVEQDRARIRTRECVTCSPDCATKRSYKEQLDRYAKNENGYRDKRLARAKKRYADGKKAVQALRELGIHFGGEDE